MPSDSTVSEIMMVVECAQYPKICDEFRCHESARPTYVLALSSVRCHWATINFTLLYAYIVRLNHK